MSAAQWDRIVDVVVVGTGGGALVAATMAADAGAEVLVLEKGDMLGGTTAVSGGVMWLPCNHKMAEAGIPDDRDAAIAYIKRVTMGTEPDPELIGVYVDAGAEMLRYLEANTPLTCHITPMIDYYSPWGIPGQVAQPGRGIEADPYPVGSELPEWADRIVKRGTLMSLGAATTLSEDFAPPTPELLAELARREAEDIRPKGAALIARLFKGLLERGVTTLLSTPAKQLVLRDGDVIGVKAEHDGQPLVIGARKGVVLACGGFEWNPELVRTHLGYTVYPLSPGGNTGDGLAMAMQAGAALGNMTSYWGTPVMFDPEITRDGERVPQFDWARGAAASIIVDKHGKRFANEALPYNDFPKAFAEFDGTALEFPHLGAPGWMVFDQSVRDASRILSMIPGQPTPEWVPVADTIRDLAGKIGVDPDALEATVNRFNEHAEKGEDPDFGRHKVGLMAPGQMAPIRQAPFYAVEMHPGMLGTNGGPRLNRDGQVLRHGGGVVGGLYAAGNTAANVFGHAYPSGGGTIGNATVFGYLAGKHVGAQPSRDI